MQAARVMIAFRVPAHEITPLMPAHGGRSHNVARRARCESPPYVVGNQAGK
jgi:hypothetical protein